MVFSYRLCCEAFLSATYTDMLAPAMGSMFLADAVKRGTERGMREFFNSLSEFCPQSID